MMIAPERRLGLRQAFRNIQKVRSANGFASFPPIWDEWSNARAAFRDIWYTGSIKWFPGFVMRAF